MTSSKPSVAHGLAVGSLKHFVAAVVGPVVIIYTAAALYSGSPVSDTARVLLVGTSVVSGVQFLFQQTILVWAALRLWKRSQGIEEDAAHKLLSTVIAFDVLALALLVVMLDNAGIAPGDVSHVFFLLAPGLYGAVLFARTAGAALQVDRAEPVAAEDAVEPPDPRPITVFSMPGLRIYVTSAVAVLAFAAVGWPQEWPRTFAIALLSIGSGHAAVLLADRMARRHEAH